MPRTRDLPGPSRRITVTIEITEPGGKQTPRGAALDGAMGLLEGEVDRLEHYAPIPNAKPGEPNERRFTFSMISWEPAK